MSGSFVQAEVEEHKQKNAELQKQLQESAAFQDSGCSHSGLGCLSRMVVFEDHVSGQV